MSPLQKNHYKEVSKETRLVPSSVLSPLQNTFYV